MAGLEPVRTDDAARAQVAAAALQAGAQHLPSCNQGPGDGWAGRWRRGGECGGGAASPVQDGGLGVGVAQGKGGLRDKAEDLHFWVPRGKVLSAWRPAWPPTGGSLRAGREAWVPWSPACAPPPSLPPRVRSSVFSGFRGEERDPQEGFLWAVAPQPAPTHLRSRKNFCRLHSPGPVGAWGACPWGPASGHQSSPVGVSVLGQWAEGLTTKSRFSDLIGSLGNRVGVSAEERGVAFPRQKEQGLGFKSKLFPTSLRSAKPAS